MIGSRAKVARIFDALAGEGTPAEWLRQVRAPVGLRIGAITPEEIAVSIVAEIIAVRRGAESGRRRRARGHAGRQVDWRHGLPAASAAARSSR